MFSSPTFRSPRSTKPEAQFNLPASLTNDLRANVESVRQCAGDEGLLFSLPDAQPAERRQLLRLWGASGDTGWVGHAVSDKCPLAPARPAPCRGLLDAI